MSKFLRVLIIIEVDGGAPSFVLENEMAVSASGTRICTMECRCLDGP